MLLAGWLIKSSRPSLQVVWQLSTEGALPVHMLHIKSHHVAQQVEFKKPRTVLWRETGWKTNQQTGEKEPWKHLTPVFLDVPLRFKRCWCLVESSRGSWIPVISPLSAQECKKTCKRCRETEWIFWEFVNGHFFLLVTNLQSRHRERLKATLKPLPVALEGSLAWNSAVNHWMGNTHCQPWRCHNAQKWN